MGALVEGKQPKLHNDFDLTIQTQDTNSPLTMDSSVELLFDRLLLKDRQEFSFIIQPELTCHIAIYSLQYSTGSENLDELVLIYPDQSDSDIRSVPIVAKGQIVEARIDPYRGPDTEYYLIFACTEPHYPSDVRHRVNETFPVEKKREPIKLRGSDSARRGKFSLRVIPYLVR